MRVQILPSTIDEASTVSQRQHLMTVIIEDEIAIDAGCLALSCTSEQKRTVRDIVLTHTHLDHIAALPMFVDDLFATLTRPITVHATAEMIEVLETHIFNWSVYPRFSELRNDSGRVLEYSQIERGKDFHIGDIRLCAYGVNHKVSANGFIIDRGGTSVLVTGDTAETSEIWAAARQRDDLKAVFVECAFPESLTDIAEASDHLTARKLAGEIGKFNRSDVPIYVMNIKPMYRDAVIEELQQLNLPNLNIAEIGRVYEL